MTRESNSALNTVRKPSGLPPRREWSDARLAAMALGAIVPLSCLLMAVPSQAMTDVWTGVDPNSSFNGFDNWSDPANWSPQVPLPGDSVIIPNKPNQPFSSGGFTLDSLTIEAGATLQMGRNASLGTGGPLGPGPVSNINVSDLSISAGGVFDLNNNHMIIHYVAGTQAATDEAIGGYLKNGYDGGDWRGTPSGGSILSSIAQPGGGGYGLGYGDGADGVVAGLPSGEIEIADTIPGDANLDGLDNPTDFVIVVTHLGTLDRTWDQGDFDYDGVVTGSDYTAMVGDFLHYDTHSAVELGSSAYATDGLTAEVPEPATASMLLIGGAGMFVRRRRKQLA